MMSQTPRVIISSYKGKNGKTTAALAVAEALIRRGLRVSMFKVGPDFIDPSYHSALIGEPSRNLDHVLMKDLVVERFLKYSAGKDIAIIEGVAGLYDSPDGESEEGSTAQMAKLLKAPVILVINGERVNRTAAAIARGLVEYDREVKIAGAVLTNVVEGQDERISRALEREGIEVVGRIMRSDEVEGAMGYRHLGLVHMSERSPEGVFNPIFRASSVNADAVIRIAREGSGELSAGPYLEEPPPRGGLRVAIAHGRAFSFYYPEVLESASAVGEVRLFDPEIDQSVDADIMIIGGGFPEIYGESLERNRPMRSSIRAFVERGGRVYAECGGLMYLTRSIVYGGKETEMVGVIDTTSVVLDRPVGHGYVRARAVRETPVFREGEAFVGHEFHYAKLIPTPKGAALKVEGKGGEDGYVVNNAYAHFIHVHPSTLNYVYRMALRAQP